MTTGNTIIQEFKYTFEASCNIIDCNNMFDLLHLLAFDKVQPWRWLVFLCLYYQLLKLKTRRKKTETSLESV